MRKNSPRKWLHACLDLLPVILIPVFMIYSHRHTIDSGTIEVSQNQVVDFNQSIDTISLAHSSPDTTEVIQDNGVYMTFDTSATATYCYLTNNHNFDFHSGDKYVFRYSYDTNLTTFDCRVYFSNAVSTEQILSFHLFENTSALSSVVNSSNEYPFIAFYLDGFNAIANDTYFAFKLNLFNLTQMFGNGNEPTLEQFNQWFTQDYYAYTLSHKELLKGTSTITYSDTDIMSQATYQLYNAVDKYFNMGNVFNLGGVYDWFNLNIFSGNAPISIYIVWNIVLYEFVMDLMFLLYGLFMWFIDMVQYLMEKPFKSIK